MTPDREDGVVLVWVLALGCVLLTLLGAGAVLADLLAARQRAAAAADLAALAAAPATVHGQAEACHAASLVAVANGAVVVACAQVSGDVEVTVEVRPRSSAAARVAAMVLPGGIRVAARAGLR